MIQFSLQLQQLSQFLRIGEEIARMAITQRIVVTVSAQTPIYVVLEQTPKTDVASGRSDGRNSQLLLGQGGLNQPLSESDVTRERLSNNIGEASDEEISRMAITQRIVVTVSAQTPIYVVLEQTPKTNGAWGRSDGRHSQSLTSNAEELRQLLQLKRELNQASGTPQ